jgi:hypothetical protein
MSLVRYSGSLALACLGLLFGSQRFAYALPLDLGRAASPSPSYSLQEELDGNKPLSWAVLNALASSHVATGTNTAAGGFWQPQSLLSSSSSDCVALRATEGSQEECYLDRPEFSVSNWLDDLLGGDLPRHAKHGHCLCGPVPVIPLSRGEHQASDGLMIPSQAFRPHPVTRFVPAEVPLAPAPYLTSLLRPPKARFSLEALWL